MPRCSSKRLIVSVTLMAVGLAIAICVFQFEVSGSSIVGKLIAAPLWIGGGMLIGTGALAPFRLEFLGAVIGFVVQFLLMAAFVAYLAFFAWFVAPGLNAL